MVTAEEISVNFGNFVFKVWQALPDPKPNYTEFYYDKREQSLSDIEQLIKKIGGSDADNQ